MRSTFVDLWMTQIRCLFRPEGRQAEIYSMSCHEENIFMTWGSNAQNWAYGRIFRAVLYHFLPRHLSHWGLKGLNSLN